MEEPAPPIEPDPLFAAARAWQRRPWTARWASLAVPLAHYGLYLLFHLIASPILGLRSLRRARKRGHGGIVALRLFGGSLPPRKGRWTILYAGGMGEKRAAFAFAEKLMADRESDVAVLVQASNASQIGHAYVPCGVMPFNNPISVLLFWLRWRPRAILGVEFWDNHHLAAAATLSGTRTGLFNVPATEQALSKVTARNRWRYRLVEFYCCQSEAIVERMRRRAGVPGAALVDTGPLCIRVDPVQGLAQAPEDVRRRLQSELRLGPGDFPVVLAGSTYRDEEEILLDAFDRLRAEFPRAVLILAPRGVRRPGGCDSALVGRNLSFVRRSQPFDALPESRIVLIDVTGELKYLYSVGTVAFVGGSMGFQGSGHTPVEAMAWYLPITIGPVHPQQKIIVDRLREDGIAVVCADAAELADAWIRFSRDEPLRRGVAEATQRLLGDSDEMILRLYDQLLA